VRVAARLSVFGCWVRRCGRLGACWFWRCWAAPWGRSFFGVLRRAPGRCVFGAAGRVPGGRAVAASACCWCRVRGGGRCAGARRFCFFVFVFGVRAGRVPFGLRALVSNSFLIRVFVLVCALRFCFCVSTFIDAFIFRSLRCYRLVIIFVRDRCIVRFDFLKKVFVFCSTAVRRRSLCGSFFSLLNFENDGAFFVSKMKLLTWT